jgi:hypothetical protein
MAHKKAADDAPDAPVPGLVSVAVFKEEDTPEGFVSHVRAEAARTAHDVASQVRGFAGDLADKGAGAAAAATAHASSSAHDFASHVAEGVRGVAGDLAERGADVASAATARARSAAIDLEAKARGNPLGAIAAAFAVGAVLGLLRRR